MPVTRGDSRGDRELGGGKDGKNRARRNELFHLREGNASDLRSLQGQTRLGGEFEGFLAILPPRAGTRVAGVVEAAWQGLSKKWLEPMGDIRRVGWSGKFVIHRFHMVVFERVLNDHIHKRRLRRAEDPRHAHDEVRWRIGENEVFAVEFGLAIPPTGIRRIGLRVGSLFFAVEDIVCAEVNESRAAPGGRFRHELWGQRVDRLCFLPGAFAAIHIRRSRAIHQNIKLDSGELCSEFFEIRDIGLRAAPANDRVVSRPAFRERRGQATLAAEDQDFFRGHGKKIKRADSARTAGKIFQRVLYGVSTSLSMMTVLEVLNAATSYLQKQGVESPRLNAEHLLAHSLGMPRRMDLYLAFDRPLGEKDRAPLRDLVKRRSEGVPLQHLLGTVEFLGREFLCDARGLIPRPETEELVELVLKAATSAMSFLDVGTGSGAIALSLALEKPEARVTACDFSPQALALAAENCARHGLEERVGLIESDLLASVEGSFDVVVANLPYIPTAEISGLSREVLQDPLSALDGGDDGLRLIERLADQLPKHLSPGGLLALEIGHDQSDKVLSMLKDRGFQEVLAHADHQGCNRFVTARK